MTALLRTRGSSSEMARLFAAEPDSALDWRTTIWAGDAVSVVLIDENRRRLTTACWGLPARSFNTPVPSKQRGTLYPRDLGFSSRLHHRSGFRRCLIIVESFAYPGCREARCTREWFGLWDEALTAWAGLYEPEDGSCAGLLVRSNERVEPCSSRMPLLLTARDRERWLSGDGLLALGFGYDTEAFYRENLGERWATGLQEEAALPLFSASA